MYTIRELIDTALHVQAYRRPDGWQPSRPLPPPVVVRLRDAWAVLRGRADAVRWTVLVLALLVAVPVHAATPTPTVTPVPTDARPCQPVVGGLCRTYLWNFCCNGTNALCLSAWPGAARRCERVNP